MEKLYTIKEAAAFLRVAPITLFRWEKQGQLKVIRLAGGQKRIAESELKRIVGK